MARCHPEREAKGKAVYKASVFEKRKKGVQLTTGSLVRKTSICKSGLI